MRIVYHLEGLRCANCAAKIETAASNLENVKDAVVDFSTSRIFLDVVEGHKAQIKASLQETVATVEPHVVVSEQRVEVERPNFFSARNLSFALGILSFLVALFLPYSSTKNLLYIVAFLFAGYEIILNAYRNIGQGQIFDENFLMTIATVGALAIGEFPEAASVMIFYRTGEFLQSLAVDRSRRSISSLIAIKPETAHRKQDETIIDIPVEHVRIGDLIVVRPGERVPVDGKVLDGSSSLDTSALTGESLPREVTAGEEVLAGSINLSGLLTIETSRLAADSAVSRILDLVENATSNKAPTEDFITTFARYYTPVVVAIAAIIAIIPPLFFGGIFNDWFYRALVFLVISCPCALVVSVPLGFFAGIGRASKQGVLVKGSNYLQALHETGTVVFDKTGTLTSGKFQVEEVIALEPFSQEEVLEAAAFAESGSSHPLALSIVRAYGKPIKPNEVVELEEFSGLGVKVVWREQEILVGSKRLLAEAGIEATIDSDQSGVHVAIDRLYAGAIKLVDSLKSNSVQTIQELNSLSIKTFMLTGDSASVAKKIGEELGQIEVFAELLPDQKVEELERIMSERSTKGKVVFTGDGINDAPVLARAHVGVAMGALGSEAAIETADVVLMTDDPYNVVDAIKTARRTNRIVWQNIGLAFVVKAVVLILGGLGLATLWEAVFADVGVTILAVLNSSRIITSKRCSSQRIM